MKTRKSKKSRGPNRTRRQPLRETMGTLMGMFRNVLLKTGQIPQSLFFWSNNTFCAPMPPLSQITPHMAEAVELVQRTLRKTKAQQVIVVDHIYMAQQPLFGPIPDSIKDQPGSFESIVMVGANKRENIWLAQPFYRKNAQSTDIVFDDLVAGENAIHPWFRGIEFTDFTSADSAGLPNGFPTDRLRIIG